MNITIKILRDIGLISVAIGALSVLGIFINGLEIWNTLTSIFAIIRILLGLMDWGIPINGALLPAVGLSLSLAGAEWLFESGLIPIKWFRNKTEKE